jgi:hypothetical protein
MLLLCSTGIGELESENLVGIPRRLKKKRQEDFIVIEVIVSVLESAARRRLVEIEYPSACATVNCKMCRIAIALYLL